MTEQLSLLTAGDTPRSWPCPSCNGKGRRTVEPGATPANCRVCFGTGQVTYNPADTSFGY